LTHSTNIERVYGPPGTGKTTHLLNIVEAEIDIGTDPTKIGFFAFTRDAASEAKTRAMERFSLETKDLPFFRTMHSLAYRSSQGTMGLITTDGYREFMDEMNMYIPGDGQKSLWEFENSYIMILISQNPSMRIISMSRQKGISLSDAHTQLGDLSVSWPETKRIAESYNNFKETHNFYDYTDVLEMFVRDLGGILPEFDLVCIDEAQDLDKLQWQMVDIIAGKTKRLVLAGDDDQAIYKWNGAEPEMFVNREAEDTVLGQSYRVPSKVHTVAEMIANKMTDRRPKEYRPRDEEGKVVHHADIHSVPFDKEGSWLVIGQNGGILKQAYPVLKAGGHFYTDNFRKSSVDIKTGVAIIAWEALRKGREITLTEAEALYTFIPSGLGGIRRGGKNSLGEYDGSYPLTLQTLKENHGMDCPDELWHVVLRDMADADRIYITDMLRNGEQFNREPRFRVQTIHKSKGGEADHVALFTELGQKSYQEGLDDPDINHRLFYVAVTRAKQSLHIINPRGKRPYYAGL